mmetsp:Transcript_18854/g.30028  ORF Transcript_18854/g.30028 Transcript_18854/m.30028 type:complete len:149 (+) Transcript_18854:131-577(+)|eukprot:CAMPEP_0202687894 /NCGR_PEP_ID=MMETSP1385-20130828/3460_1 /ASSEMBLY_ACC=CAM_ASM_000861 /TAXON_ID=933848 /ORGANISM="Elphidium margaritaceum" /LENGTH=148 /DNA_ID=CAMNT_0049342747 /DNA_START=100 /DNA_END=546 /DNA_ORIENTATION=+
MPPKKEQKTKEQKLQAALAGSKKSKKKKWAKGRVKEKKNNTPVLLPDQYATAIKEIPKMRLITVSAVSEKLRCTGSLAHRLIRKLAKEGTLKMIMDTRGFLLYTKSAKAIREEAARAKAAEEAAALQKEKKKAAKGKAKKEKEPKTKK